MTDTNYAITDPVGMATTLTYVNGRLSTVTDPANRTTTFNHDSNRNLIKITDPDGTFRRFGYDGEHKLVSKKSKRGFTSTYSYNFAERFIESARPDGSVWLLSSKMTVGLADTANGQGTKTNPAPAKSKLMSCMNVLLSYYYMSTNSGQSIFSPGQVDNVAILLTHSMNLF